MSLMMHTSPITGWNNDDKEDTMDED